MGDDNAKLLIADETKAFKEAKANKDGTFDVCVITPGWGSSGYYSEDLLKKDGVAVLQAGLHNYWDHATTREEYERPERSLRDLAGVLSESVKWEDKGWNGPGLYAKSKVFNPYVEALSDPDFAEAIGMSLVCYGISHLGEAEGETGDIIDQITAARSVDFVTLPGRGGKVKARFESLRPAVPTPPVPQPKKEASDVTEEEARQLREKVSQLEGEKTKLEESNAELTKENGTLKGQVKDFEEAKVRREARTKVLEVLGKVKKMPKSVKNRIASEVVRETPFREDGSLHVDKLGDLIKEKVEAEEKYLTDIGFGKVKGLGGTDLSESEDDPDDPDEEDDEDTETDDENEDEEDKPKPESKRLTDAFLRMGDGSQTPEKAKKLAEAAAAGR